MPQNTPCDIDVDNRVDIQDVQRSIYMTLGLAPCVSQVTGYNQCSAITVTRIYNAVLTSSCHVDPFVHLRATPPTVPPDYYEILRSGVPGGPYFSVGTTTTIEDPVGFTDGANSVTRGSQYYYVGISRLNTGEFSPNSNEAPALIPASGVHTVASADERANAYEMWFRQKAFDALQRLDSAASDLSKKGLRLSRKGVLENDDGFAVTIKEGEHTVGVFSMPSFETLMKTNVGDANLEPRIVELMRLTYIEYVANKAATWLESRDVPQVATTPAGLALRFATFNEALSRAPTLGQSLLKRFADHGYSIRTATDSDAYEIYSLRDNPFGIRTPIGKIARVSPWADEPGANHSVARLARDLFGN